MTLDEICIKNGTDKGTSHQYTAHGYAPFYDRFFTPFRFESIRMVEIGVGGGESIQTWLDYFPLGKVVGIDTVHDTNPWNNPNESPTDRYKFINGDQSDLTFLACFAADFPEGFEIIIDDGGHYSQQVITSFNKLWPLVKSGGLYCIEDLGTAYGQSSVFLSDGYKNHAEFVKAKLDDINLDRDGIAAMYAFKELAILVKK